MSAPQPVVMIFSAPPAIIGHRLLNPNAFPSKLTNELQPTIERLSLLWYNANSVGAHINSERDRFHKQLLNSWNDCQVFIRSRPDLSCIARSDGLLYISPMHATLYELKACLDLYARLVVKLMSEAAGPTGFSRGKVDGKDLSGGKLINWINGQSASNIYAAEVANLFRVASESWITEAVHIRDTIVHFRDLPNLRHMSIVVQVGMATIAANDIALPEMPNGESLDEFCVNLASKLSKLISQTVRLLPQVNVDLLECWSEELFQ